MRVVLRAVNLLLVLAIFVIPWASDVIEGEDNRGAFTADVVLVIDRTTSMGALDYGSNLPRMDGVAKDIAQIADSTVDVRFSVVVMDNTARVSMPWTSDTLALKSLAQTIGWREESLGTGTDIGIGVEEARGLLEKSVEARPKAKRYLIYFGDGEQTAEAAPTSFASLADLLDGSLVLGYGTTGGAAMRVSASSSEVVVRNGEVAKSQLDESNLQEIASQLDGDYIHRTGSGKLPLWSGMTEVSETAQYQLRDQIKVEWVLALLVSVLTIIDLGLTVHQAKLRRIELGRGEPA